MFIKQVNRVDLFIIFHQSEKIYILIQILVGKNALLDPIFWAYSRFDP